MSLHREDIPISCSHESHEPGVACELWFHGKCCGYKNVEACYLHDTGEVVLYCPDPKCHKEIARIAVASRNA